jgi:two-component system chemotaxis response regulator CheB
MPEMNGLQTLRMIRSINPRVPVIMFSALTERGAAETLEALHSGASDYMTKPSSTAGRAFAEQRIREDLLPKIKSLCRLGPGRDQDAPRVPLPRPAASPLRAATAVTAEVVTIGLSTGGPTALAQIFTQLPADFPAPIAVVQHMPQMFTRFFAERLNAQTSLTVIEAVDGQQVQRGVVYVAPGDYHLTFRRRNGQIITGLDQEPPEHSHRPSADVLFRSAADVYGPRALGVVLTGMGQDALRGSEDIIRAGGRVVVQDEATSVVWEMAGLVARAGLADAVLPLDAVAAALMSRTGCVAGVNGSR